VGRPRGYRLSQESKDRISASQRRRWADRRDWVDVSSAILRAANEGDRDRASALLNEFLDDRHVEFQSSVQGLSALSQQDRREIIAEMADYADELHAETRRIQAARRRVTDADIETFRLSMLARVRALMTLSNQLHQGGSMDKNSPYAGIPSMTERAAARRRVANKRQGEPLGDDATPHVRHRHTSMSDAATTPFVAPTDVRHVPMTITHTHDHGAHGHPDADDGIHSHEHSHSSDALHDHSHR